MNTDEYLSVFSTWILFDQKTVLGGGSGRLIDRQIGFEQGSKRGTCIISCLLQQITVKQSTLATPIYCEVIVYLLNS
jgi:hypothetical protein